MRGGLFAGGLKCLISSAKTSPAQAGTISSAGGISSVEQKPACKYRSDRTDKICAKSSRNRMTRLRDTYRAKVNRNDVKRCFRAAIDRRCRITQNIVRSELLHQLSQYCCRAAAAQRPD